MHFDPDHHHRRSVRLRGFDYRSDGAYFVTICASGRRCIFGEVVKGMMHLNRRGMIVEASWNAMPLHRPTVELDVFQILPNHIHAIVWLNGAEAGPRDNPVGATLVSPSSPRPTGPSPGSLGAVIGAFKAAVSREINRLRPGAGKGIWQPNFYEHVIRDEWELRRIRGYIETNPERWPDDAENPIGSGRDGVDLFMESLCDPRRQAEGDTSVAPTKALLAKHER